MTDERQSLDAQLTAAAEDLTYPITDETDLAPTFPSWAATRFESDEFSATPRELLLLLPDDGYPYESAAELVGTLEARLRERGHLD